MMNFSYKNVYLFSRVVIGTQNSKFESGFESGLESTPFFLESESGFMFFRSESESESSSKSLESGFESESGFGFAHH